MKKTFLEMAPKRFLCPYCGEWHETRINMLIYHDSEAYKATLKCIHDESSEVQMYFNGEICYYLMTSQADSEKRMNRIPISQCIASQKQPVVTFEMMNSNHDTFKFGFEFDREMYEKTLSSSRL